MVYCIGVTMDVEKVNEYNRYLLISGGCRPVYWLQSQQKYYEN
jgi:hypothetical protein